MSHGSTGDPGHDSGSTPEVEPTQNGNHSDGEARVPTPGPGGHSQPPPWENEPKPTPGKPARDVEVRRGAPGSEALDAATDGDQHHDWRMRASAVGEAMETVPKKPFTKYVKKTADGIQGLREGVAEHEANRDREVPTGIELTADTEVDGIRADGKAHALKATRLGEDLHKLDGEIADERSKEEDLETKVDQAEARVVEESSQDRERRPHLYGWIRSIPLSVRAMLAVFIAETVFAPLSLIDPIREQLETQTAYLPEMLAYVTGFAAVGLASTVGVILAAMRLPARALLGGLAALGLAWIALYIPALEKLRDEEGISVLTFTSAAVLLVSVATSCLWATRQMIERDLADPTTPLGKAVADVHRLREKLGRCRQTLSELLADRKTLVGAIAATHSRVETMEVRIYERIADGIRAGLSREVIERTLEIYLVQEGHNAAIWKAAVRAAWDRVRTMELEPPPEVEVVSQEEPRLSWFAVHWRTMVLVALAVAIAVVAAIILGSLVPVLAGLVLAVVLVLGSRREQHRGAITRPPFVARPQINEPPTGKRRLFTWPADRYYSNTDDGGGAPVER